MTRPVKRAGVIALVLAVALVVLLPLRIVFDMSGLGARGISARSVEGSIWSGTIRDLRLGRLSLGDMDAAVSPGSLLRGELIMAMARASDAPGQPALAFDLVAGGVAKSADTIAMRNAAGEVATADLFAPLPLRSVALDGVNVAFTGGRCSAASGTVRVNIEQSLFGISLQRGLTGILRCDGSDVLVPLKGQSGLEQMDIRVTGSGRYTADFKLGGLAGGAGAALAALGFRQQGDAMAIRISGQF